MSENEAELSPFDEFQEEITGPWRKLRAFWRDRQRILDEPRIPASKRPHLKNRPYSFATQSLMVIPLIFGLTAPVVTFLFDLPPTPAEREIGYYQAALDWTDAALAEATSWPPVPKALPLDLSQLSLLTVFPKTPNADPTLRSLQQELKRVIAERRAISKIDEALRSMRMLIVGLGFLLNSYLFRYLVRRMRPPARRGDRGHAFHLYYVGALLFWPTSFLSAALPAAVLADRVAGEALLWPTFLAVTVTGLWGLLLLRGRSAALARAFPPTEEADERKWGNRLLNRLAVSNVVTNISVNIVTGLVIFGLFKLAVMRMS